TRLEPARVAASARLYGWVPPSPQQVAEGLARAAVVVRNKDREPLVVLGLPACLGPEFGDHPAHLPGAWRKRAPWRDRHGPVAPRGRTIRCSPASKVGAEGQFAPLLTG